MSSYVEYPHAMRLEALKLIQAAEADPGEQSAMAIYEFIERSPEHEACLDWQYQCVTFYRNHIASSRETGAAPALWRMGTDSRFLFGLAAAVLIVAVGLYAFLSARPADLAQQTAAESTVHTLEDGSHVVLFPHSSMTSGRRRINLLSGGLAAKPTHDASRPFELVAGNTRVTALGTEFSVLRLADGTEVVLSEGRVLVSADSGDSRELREPGEFTRVTAKGVVSDPRQKSAMRPALRLTPFESATLSDVAAAFNKHNSTLQIEVKGDRRTRYDFRLQLDNPEEWLTELKKMPLVQVERRFDVITIVTITVLG